MNNKLKILAFGGSLRKDSFNKALLYTAAEMCPEEANFELFEKLDQFPPFNQDIDPNRVDVVKEFKTKIRQADAILISTPEYNYSVPGYLKNAIDWASRPYGDNSFDDKPVAIMSASGGMLGGARAQYALRKILVFLNMHAVNRPEVMVPLAKDKIIDGKVIDEHTIEKIRDLIDSLIIWTIRINRKIAVPFQTNKAL